MASGGAVAKSGPRSTRRAQAQVKASKNNTTDKWIGKKFKVTAGDVVKFHTPNAHQFGGMGTVIGYLKKNVVLVRTFGGLDNDYPPQVIEVRNQRANENYQGSGFGAHYQNYIEKVSWRVDGKKPKKKRTPVKFYEVTQEALPGVLAGTHEVPDGHKVVLLPEGEARTPTSLDERIEAIETALGNVLAREATNDVMAVIEAGT